ncbi:hypothetical protein MUY14_08190 [Amycolatopsis sp. FBCC-B4732]|uniref:hypothetical protein n=1 Tax=Amycolatopsis sp. FBCC-B4732 TaxID=3079339 RepID=UPI001FF321E6|nr:hypothetical protein [Amycolatopsis sp. FBCC-B4732]UOX90591.1 hypothetical protein MUY14_08190 [Amycolatopsis sp. FBCC-B4732]
MTTPRFLNRRTALALLAAGLAVLLTACAPAADVLAGSASQPGFWLGLWHGFICPISFVVSLFDDHVGVYEVHNSGHLYDFGFVFGIVLAAGVFHGPGYTRRRRTRRSPGR